MSRCTQHAKSTTKVLGAVALSFALTAPSQAAQNLTAESAGAGGVTHTLTTHFAESLSDAGIAELQVQSGQTLTNTLINVGEGKTDVGVIPLILAFLLEHGRGPYSKQGAEKGSAIMSNVRAIYPHNLGAFMLFAYESTGITSYKQLSGKTIYNGPPRGGALVNARQILKVVSGLGDGKGYTGFQVNWGQMSKTISDGSADANMLPMTLPSPIITAALAAGNLNIISVPKDIYEGDAFTRLTKGPGGAGLVMDIADMGYGDGVKVQSEDGKFRAMVTAGAQIVNKNLSNDLVKSMVATHIANIDKLLARVPFAKNLGLKTVDAAGSGFCGPVPLKYHPGAIMAWEEAGYTIPDCAKP